MILVWDAELQDEGFFLAKRLFGAYSAMVAFQQFPPESALGARRWCCRQQCFRWRSSEYMLLCETLVGRVGHGAGMDRRWIMARSTFCDLLEVGRGQSGVSRVSRVH